MTAEAEDLWTRAIKAFATARRLIAEDPDASTSRAYYAAFYAVSALFAQERRNFTRHTALEAAVHRSLVKTGRWGVDLGKAFSFLLNLRSTADYGGDLHASTEEAQTALTAAERILVAVRDQGGFSGFAATGEESSG